MLNAISLLVVAHTLNLMRLTEVPALLLEIYADCHTQNNAINGLMQGPEGSACGAVDRRAAARATFRVLDVNNDGVAPHLLTLVFLQPPNPIAGELFRDELAGGLCDAGITDAEIEQLLLQLDTDHDGKVCALTQPVPSTAQILLL